VEASDTGDKINILGLSGSLRQSSYNRALLRAAVAMAPANASLDIFDVSGIPPLIRISKTHHRKRFENSRIGLNPPMPY